MTNRCLRTEHLTFSYPAGEEQPPTLALDGADARHRARAASSPCSATTAAANPRWPSTFNAVLLPAGGRVYVDGMDTVRRERCCSTSAATVGMVFQNPDNQIVANVVEEDVAFAPENLGVPPEEIRRARGRGAASTVGMYEYSRSTRRTCSPADRSSASPSRACMAMRPQCIVLDEPTAMLDPSGPQRGHFDHRTAQPRARASPLCSSPTTWTRPMQRRPRDRDERRASVAMDGAPREVFSQVEKLQVHRPDRAGHGAELCIRAARRRAATCRLTAITVDECADAVARRFGKLRKKRTTRLNEIIRIETSDPHLRRRARPFATARSTICTLDIYQRASLSASSGTRAAANRR